MNATIVLALVLTLSVYLSIALRQAPKIRSLDQLLPLTGRAAHIGRADEFATNTVATSISLATVVLAIFELFPYLKFWLLWTAVTTAGGLLVVRAMSGRIWAKMQTGGFRPTLHEFLGREFGTKRVTAIAALFTCLGFMGALAVELSVGARFVSSLVGAQHLPWLVGLGVVVFVCTGIGGYRGMVVAERLQMYTIYVLLAMLALYLTTRVSAQGVVPEAKEMALLPVDAGLASFIIGIACINLPSFVSDMSIWQRIAATKSPEVLRRGLNASWAGSAITWSCIVFLAWGTCLILVPADGTNPLFALFALIVTNPQWWSFGLAALIVTGLLGAMVSTASTQLMAASHAFYEDICTRGDVDHAARLADTGEVRRIRWFMLGFTALAVAVVETLTYLKFSISDLVFAIFGSQLSLFPPVLLALLNQRWRLRAVQRGAVVAMTAGFVAGWSSAIAGKITGNTDLVFLAPVASLVVSGLFLTISILTKRNELRAA